MTIYEQRPNGQWENSRPRMQCNSPVDPPHSDLCASCDRPIMVRTLAWLGMRSKEGLAAAANICADPECAEVADLFPDSIAERLSARRLRVGSSVLR